MRLQARDTAGAARRLGSAGQDKDALARTRTPGVQGLVQRQEADRWRTRGSLAALCLSQPEMTELSLAQPEKTTIRALKNTTQSENNNERSKETPRIDKSIDLILEIKL
ncbi:hypothetical protein Syun_011852 [Stephania yunnanensis]|uniref:Uncharacterized protein n=1 Tax=Stephania yunnanensis TaxID=152371 RepID=A0AAP0JYE0_9MAGN